MGLPVIQPSDAALGDESLVAAIPESVAARLAKNLLAARTAAGLTQAELAGKADVSRATIAQLETGICDPKLSTVDQLAKALGINSILLTLGRAEIGVVGELWDARIRASEAGALLEAELPALRRLVRSGMLKDRMSAVRLATEAARRTGLPSAAIVGAAIGAPIEPGIGTAVGALLGLLLQPGDSPTTTVDPNSLIKKVTATGPTMDGGRDG